MSVEQARKMIERLKTDEAFKARVMAIADLDGWLKLAAAEGFDCTKDELASVASELTESDLGTVCAGSEDGAMPRALPVFVFRQRR